MLKGIMVNSRVQKYICLLFPPNLRRLYFNSSTRQVAYREYIFDNILLFQQT